MTLGQRVENDLKNALKSHDSLRVASLRLMRNAFKNKAKDILRELDAEEEIKILKSMAKQRRESIELFQAGAREDLAQREREELLIIEEYLPAPIDQRQIEQVLDEVFALLKPEGPRDTGKIMKEALARLGSAADAKLVNQLVRVRF